MDASPPPIIAQEIRLVDEEGLPRVVLSTRNGIPTIRLLRTDGESGGELSLDMQGRPAMKLANTDPNGPTAALEIDDKGAHVKFDRAGGASSYLFLNNTGGSGIALFDSHGIRRLNAVVDPDGTSKIERLDSDGKPLP